MNNNNHLSPFPLKNTVAPFNNVNQHLVNIDASNWSGGFSSNETSLQFGLPAMRNNVQAAGASALQKGGARKTLRKKIKNIAKKYKMPKRKQKSMKRRLKRTFKGGYLIGKTKRVGKKSSSSVSSSSRKKRGGGTYHQYGSQIPNTPSYSTPGFSLGSKNLGLANPPPIREIGSSSKYTNCIDNYNHNTNKGYQFW